MSDAGDSRQGLVPFLALLFALGLLVRLPLAGLPLEGDAAALATRAAGMAAETAWSLEAVDRRGPLVPLLLAVPTAAGATPTFALRFVDALLGALIAPLACALCLGLGLGRRSARWTGILLTAHPMLALGAGGALPGTAGLACVLLLLALLFLGRPGRGGRRAGLLLVLLLPLAEPACAVYLPFLVALWVRREHSEVWRAAGLILALGALAATPFPTHGLDGGIGARLLAFGLQWIPASLLLGLVPFLHRGVRAAWTGDGRAKAWMGGAALHAVALLLLPAPVGFAFGWEGLVVGLPLVPLAVLLGVAGLEARAPVWRPRLVRGILGVAVAGSLFLAIGPLQTWLLPTHTPPTGRLWRLARVARVAEEHAAPSGWVGVDVGDALDAYETERLGDLFPKGRALPLKGLPEEALDGPLVVLARHRPMVLDVVTLGGRGIFEQEPVYRLGPWLVLRLARP